MLCKKCGNELSVESKFCSKCGEKAINDVKHGGSNYVAGRGVRFSNYIVDYFFITIPVFFLAVAWGMIDGLASPQGVPSTPLLDTLNTLTPSLMGFSLVGFMPLYYILFEYFWQKTPGKWITKTKVVNLDGSRPGFWKLVARTLARWIPLEWMTFLSSPHPRGWHDRISGTMVVLDSYPDHDAGTVVSPKKSWILSPGAKIIFSVLAFAYVVSVIGSLASETDSIVQENTDTTSSWITYSSPRDSFTILLPAYPAFKEEGNIPVDELGGTYSYHEYQAVDDTTSYFVYRFIYSDVVDTEDGDGLLRSYLDQMLSIDKSNLTASSFGYYKGYRVLDFSFTIKGEIAQGRFILVGETPYLLMMDHYPEKYDEQKYTSFITSFTVD